MNCCICGIELSEEKCSVEHIIPRGIGGRLTSKNIFCKTCNNKLGTEIDSDFVNVFHPILNNLNISKKFQGKDILGIVISSEYEYYEAKIKNNKITSMFDSSKQYVEFNPKKHRLVAYKFDLDNKSFRKGLAKIAFDYAIEKKN